MSETKEFPLKNVEIIRGRDVLTVEVPAHEVRVLQAIHGPERVTVVGDAEDGLEFEPSAAAEWDRLTRKYERINAPDMVRVAYPRGAIELEAHGFTGGEGAVKAAPQAMFKKGAKKAPAKK